MHECSLNELCFKKAYFTQIYSVRSLLWHLKFSMNADFCIISTMSCTTRKTMFFLDRDHLRTHVQHSLKNYVRIERHVYNVVR